MLKQKILQKLDAQRGLADKMAKIAGYSSGSALRKVLKNENKEVTKFYGIIKVLRVLYPDEERQMLKDLAQTVYPSKHMARVLLEYYEVNKMVEEKRVLINRMLECNNLLSKERATIYHIDDLYTSGKVTFLEALEMYGKLNVKDTTSKVATIIYRSYCYLDQRMYTALCDSNVVFRMLKEVNSGYLRDIFYARLKLFEITATLNRCDIDSTRRMCRELLCKIEEDSFRSMVYLYLGNSYMLYDYYRATFYFEKGLSYVVDGYPVAKTNLQRSYDFTNMLWGKQPMFSSVTSDNPTDIHQVAFKYILLKDYKKAEDTLNKINFETLSENRKGFHMYYRGLISGNMDDFTKSIIHFKKSQDRYYRQLPIQELRKLGINESLLEALSI